MIDRDDSDRLLPCPFCGGYAEIGKIEEGDNAGGTFAECTNMGCGASTCLVFPCGEDPVPYVMERWNRRPVRNACECQNVGHCDGSCAPYVGQKP